jgi:hypothetical protein
MNDFTQQMFNDYRHYTKETRWDDFENGVREEIELLGVEEGIIVNILDIYKGKDLIRRVYQRKSEVGTDSGFYLDCANASERNLNLLIETV